MIARMIYVFPDPRAGVSPLIPQSPNTSTFRVFVQDDPSEWITVSDQSDESVLSGLSRVGGLWAFLSGVFTVIFGTSLLRILSGKGLPKTISLFNRIHHVQPCRC